MRLEIWIARWAGMVLGISVVMIENSSLSQLGTVAALVAVGIIVGIGEEAVLSVLSWFDRRRSRDVRRGG